MPWQGCQRIPSFELLTAAETLSASAREVSILLLDHDVRPHMIFKDIRTQNCN
jgi:hypothetical protein